MRVTAIRTFPPDRGGEYTCDLCDRLTVTKRWTPLLVWDDDSPVADLDSSEEVPQEYDIDRARDEHYIAQNPGRVAYDVCWTCARQDASVIEDRLRLKLRAMEEAADILMDALAEGVDEPSDRDEYAWMLS